MMCFLRRSTPICCAIVLFLLFLLHPCHYAFSKETVDEALKPDQEVEEELKYLQAETYVITPSKIPQRIEKAPGTIHVVTDKEIRQMGARYLYEVIQTVPGWYVYNDYRLGYSVFVRGASGIASSRIMFMVNSHNVNNYYLGSGIESYANLDLDNVQKIEFVSGPVSALYGSGAMNGVINIITKEAEDVDGLQMTARGGSFNTWEGNALFGKTIHGLEVAGYLNYRNTDGFRGHVDQDQQSVLDRRYGTHASLAPGSMKGDLYNWDAQLTLKYNGFKFDGKLIDQRRDLPLGWRPILDNMTTWKNRDSFLNLSYDTTLSEGLNLMARAYRNEQSTDVLSQYFPKGSLMLTPKGPAIMKEDKYNEMGNKNSRMGAEVQLVYEIVDSNNVVAGITYEQQKFYDPYRRGNVWPTSNPNVWIPLSSVQDIPPEMMAPTEKRDVWAVYVEDIWDILDELRLTAAGRYDYYSGSGGQFSPRIGINWDITQNYYTKFIYGRSFKVPSYYDLYSIEIGNPNLKNQTSDSFECILGADLLPFSAQLTGFYGKSRDIITMDLTGTPPTYRAINADTAEGYGATFEIKYDFGRGTYLGLNYTHLETKLSDPRYIVYSSPERLGTFTANIRLSKHLNWNTQVLYRGGWSRGMDDPRDDLGDYAIVNTTMLAKDFLGELKGLEVRGSVYNLFNKDYTMPMGAGELPGDIPMPGINFMLELRYTF
jgi:outer membrane receptor protein involved in Fe transport